MHGNEWKTVSFAAKFKNPHESNYSTNDLELLVVVWAVKQNTNYHSGSEFEIIADHEALISAHSPNHGKETYHSRLTRWVVRLLPFNFTINQLAGKDIGFSYLILKISSGIAIPPSYYDEDFMVATINKIYKVINLSDSRGSRKLKYKAIGSKSENSNYARLRNHFIAFVLKVINSTLSVCNLIHNRTDLFNSICISSGF